MNRPRIERPDPVPPSGLTLGGQGHGWSGHLVTPKLPTADQSSAALSDLERTFTRLAGVRPGDRAPLVRSMVLLRRREAAGYWLNLGLSVGIATLGLALGSTAVVIGAMLVSPLMNPIVELGMGLVTGSPVLTLRSMARGIGGIAAAILLAALLTLVLPFQEITPEISARTSPTALDLLIAVFVAVVAAMSTVRPRSDVSSTAAGTAIGISLVPPLCVIGFGLGTRNGEVAIGASLLFLTNFTAIVAVAVLCYLALGFEHIDTTDWDRRALRTARGRGIRRAAELLRSVFGSRYSRVVRVGIPIALLAVVAVPLADALRQVAWEVRARTAVGRGLSEIPAGDVVQSAVSIRGRAVNVRLYLIGTHADASAIESDLRGRVRRAVSDAEPSVRVVVVPEAAVPEPAQPVADPVATLPELVSLRQVIGETLEDAWAATGAGPIIRWDLRLANSDSIAVVPTHLGATVPAAASGLLARILLDKTGLPMAVRPAAVPDSIYTTVRGLPRWREYIHSAGPLLLSNRSLQLCITTPATADSMLVEDLVRAELPGAAPGQVQRATQPRGEYGARLSLFAEGKLPCS